MLAGMSKSEKQMLNLTTASDYIYLNQVLHNETINRLRFFFSLA